jgi:uncharacterized membrane protein YfcA
MPLKNSAIMSTTLLLGLILLGLLSGFLSGLIGIGGAVIIIPALVFLFGFEQHLAQGTTIALMVLPIGLFAAINYYQKGMVDLKTALFISLGFIIGGYLGSLLALQISTLALKRILAGVLVLIAIKLLFS